MPLFAPVPQLVMVWPLTIAIFWRERHAVEFRSTLWILAGRLPGAFIGVALLKVLSTPEDPSIGVLEGLQTIADAKGMSIQDFTTRVSTIVHGTSSLRFEPPSI